MDEFPPRDPEADMAALDMLRVLAEATTGVLIFKNTEGVDRAVHESGTSYRITRSHGSYQAVIEPPLSSLEPETLIYEGKDAAEAAGWCRLHAAHSHQKDVNFGAQIGPYRTSDGYTAIESEGAWRLFSPDREDLGSWASPHQAELVARAFKAAF